MDRTRELYHSLLEYEGAATYADVLQPWIASNPDEAQWIRDFGSRPGNPIPEADVDDLFRLYALSRVCETLVLGFQKGNADGSNWPGPVLTIAEYTSFVEAVGLTIVHPTRYTPFHHEVVNVEVSKELLTVPVLLSSHWPCLMIGNMLFMRAGATVLTSEHQLTPGIANATTIYWSYRRKNRPTNDLSKGWGSNSQWRTCLRRDYHVQDKFYFNVDGKCNLAMLPEESIDDFGLTKAERIELLVNRNFVTTEKPHDDMLPYGDTFSINAHSTTW
jgi:hypothetical protein